MDRNRHYSVILDIRLLRWAGYVCVYVWDYCICKLVALLVIYFHKNFMNMQPQNPVA